MIGHLDGGGRCTERTAPRQCIVLVLLLAFCTICGCSREKSGGMTVASREDRPQAAARTITADDLRDAERVTRAYWEAVIAGRYGEAVSHTEAAMAPEAQRKAFEAQVESAMQMMKPSAIASLGPGKQDENRPGVVLVPYQINARQSISGEAIVRKLAPSSGWLVSGGI